MAKAKDGSIHEIDDVAQMLKAAAKEGLAVEVVWSFGQALAGDRFDGDWSKAANYALNEWDI